ncbi:MAG: Gfo/Idh/MocA family oxidoreductase [Lentisphaeria bacterium]
MKNVVIAGLRHGHILGLYQTVLNDPDCNLAGVCEEDATTRKNYAAHPFVKITHTNFTAMLSEVDCDIVAIGDYYARRGSLAIEALKAGKHIISDKPLCISLDELKQIRQLAKEKNLKVGCMFDLRTCPQFVGARQLIQAGKLGKVVQIQFTAQHPLNLGVRPSWYFEPGKHGGTINDIASHAIDLIPWMTGNKFKRFIAARTWKAFDSGCDCFNDAAQFMLEMDNGCGVLGDVSYSAPTCQGLLPSYWRFNIWGTQGMLEINYADKKICFYQKGYTSGSVLTVPADTGLTYGQSFLLDIAGTPADLNTKSVLESTEMTLKLQALADKSC